MNGLDVMTLRVALGIVVLTTLILMYAVVYRTHRTAYCSWWCLSLVFFTLGTASYLLNGTAHQVWANPLGNALTVVGAGWVWLATRSLRGTTASPWWVVLAGGVAGLAGALDDPADDVWAGGAVLLAAIATLLAMATVDLLHLRRDARGGPHRSHFGFITAMTVVAGGLAIYYAARLGFFLWVGPDDALFETWVGSAPTTVVTIVVVVVISFSITGLSNEERTSTLRMRASQDPLTGLLNRADLDLLAEQEISKARFTGTPAAVVLADLDHFKQINDGYGHQAGDDVLRLFAECCRRAVRATDVVGRYGGDEFVMVLPGANADTVTATLGTIAHHFAAGQAEWDRPVRSASFGVAFSDPDSDLTRLLAKADAALYQAKARGRGQLVIS